MCETFQVSQCGNEKIWASIVNGVLLPIIFIERLSGVGVFSGIVVVLTLISISIIIYTCTDIYNSSNQKVLQEYDLIVPESIQYNYWNTKGLFQFIAAMINMFEGNLQILNLYAEIERPQQFLPMTLGIISAVAVFIAVPTSYMGYLAFGDNVSSVVIYNLPPNDVMSILAKSFYVFTVMGSYVIVIQPIFYIIEETELYKKILDQKEDSYSLRQWA